jgi:hypothetical protein
MAMLGSSCNPCCDLCVDPPPYLKMTVNGMPNAISSPYDARSFATDNGSEYTMFRITTPRHQPRATRCVWGGGGHSYRNQIGLTDSSFAMVWRLDADNERLNFGGLVFRPPDGASFKSLPYADERPLVPLSAAEGWSNLVITIDAGKASYPQCECPGYFADFSNCTGADVSGGTPVTACSTVDGAACLPVADYPVRISFEYTGPAYAPALPDLTERILVPDYQIDLSPLDSDLDLVWNNDSGLFGFNAFRYNAGNTGTVSISQGYRFAGRLTNPVTIPPEQPLPFFLFVAIRPTASVWEANGTQQCGEGQVSWNAQVFLFQTDYGIGRRLNWRVLGEYLTIPCNAYTCGEGPQSFSITKSVEFSVNPFWFAFDSVYATRYLTGSITLESA